MLRCAQSSRSNVPETGIMEWWSNGVMHLPRPTFDFGNWWGACPARKSKDRFFARLASEIFLSSLQTEFFSNLRANAPRRRTVSIGLLVNVYYIVRLKRITINKEDT